MRGRFLLLPALLLLTVSQAQAAVIGGGDDADPCVDPSPLFEVPAKPLEVVTLDPKCTFQIDDTARVMVTHTAANGTIVSIETEQLNVVVSQVQQNVSVVVTFVETGKQLAMDCSRDSLPTFPVRTWDERCWGWRDLHWLD